ncbi:MAG: class I SAM-dependent methyltransferase [Bauldia sp.]|nr:MAG: class I SAM-dependent methyltransferase [Bauldia sp.]
MSALTTFDLGDTGKIDLTQIYNQPDPRSYYQTLGQLDYRIPAEAAPVFRRVIRARRTLRQQRRMTVLDVGSSYGVNAAILKHGYGLGDLFRLYGRDETRNLSRHALIRRDQRLFHARVVDRNLVTIGLDSAARAVGYADQADILDAGLAANLEKRPPTLGEARRLAEVDLVISTGAIGYVGAPTFNRILERARRAPWFALFALRMFPVGRIAAALRKSGYSVYKLRSRTFRQRRFAGPDEAGEVLARLDGLGIDPTGREAAGWYHAEFYFAQPIREPAPPIPGLKPC